MDGTVLDLRFDNLFWLEALPHRWGAERGLDAAAALAQLKPRFDAKRGTLDWYCIDHWSEELGFDVAALKAEMRAHIRYLPGATDFLDRVRALGKRVLLTTNAHPISLDIKNRQTELNRHFDELISSHEFGVPKESPEFWARLAAWSRRGRGVHAVRRRQPSGARGGAARGRALALPGVAARLHRSRRMPPRPAFHGIRALGDLAP